MPYHRVKEQMLCRTGLSLTPFLPILMENFMILVANSSVHLVWGGIGFYFIASVTWFFSTRRSLFLKFFTAYEEDRNEADKNLPKGELFKKVSRGFAIAELAIGTVFIALAVFL